MNFVKFAGTACALSLCLGVAHAEYITGYNLYQVAGDSVSVAATEVASHITAGEMVRGAGLNGSGARNCFSSNGWDDNGADDYVAFSFTIEKGFEVNFDQLVFGIKASSSGPQNYTWKISDDAFATSSVIASADSNDTNSSGYYNAKVDISAYSFGSATEDTTIEVRMFGTDASSGRGTLRYTNYYPGYDAVGVTGEVTSMPIPEPASLALLGLGGLAILRRRK